MKKKPDARGPEKTAYAAFLRGINVGGHAVIKMDDLKKTFESLGFNNVKTLLASGNVLFEAQSRDPAAIRVLMEKGLKKAFNRDVCVTIRSIKELRNLADSNPFRNIPVTPQTRLYVTFLSEKPNKLFKAPYESPKKDYKVLTVSDTEAVSVLTLSPGSQTTDLMVFLDREFGRSVTTRNWNTIEKILGK
jgi:uncharacterized protein (DUF1697 family)